MDSTEALATSVLRAPASGSPLVPPVVEGGQAADTQDKLASLKAVQIHRDNLIKVAFVYNTDETRLLLKILKLCSLRLKHHLVKTFILNMSYCGFIVQNRPY